MASIGKTAEEIHADLIAEGHEVTLAEVEEEIHAMFELGFIQRADLSVGGAVEIVKEHAGAARANRASSAWQKSRTAPLGR